MTCKAEHSRGAWLLIATFVFFAATGRAQEPPVAETLPPSQWRSLTERLRTNVIQADLPGTQVFVAVVRADGVVQVFGTVADDSWRKQIEMNGLLELQRTAKAGAIKIPVAVNRVDASRMAALPQGRLSPLDHVLVLDKALAAIPNCLLRVETYDSFRSTVRLCGSVPSEEQHSVLKECLAGFNPRFSFDDVLVVDRKMARGDYVWSVHDVTRALASGSSEQVLTGSQQLIRFGDSSPEAWYYRAAGCLLAGNNEQAIGAVRIATSVEAQQVYSYYQSSRFHALERFQGNLREKLERMVDSGPSICIVRPD